MIWKLLILSWNTILIWKHIMLKLLEVFMKYYCCHLLPVRYGRSFQNKDLLKLFPFLSNNCQKMGNMRIGTEIVNPCIFPILPVYFIFFENLLREKSIAAEKEISYLLLIYYISDLIIHHWFCDGKENGMNWHNIV